MPAPQLYQFTYRGLVMGDGTDYEIKMVDGIESLPEVVQPDLKIDRDQGEYAGIYTMKGRLISIDLDVHAATAVAFRADLDALGAALAPIALAEQPLAFLLPGMVQLGRVSNVRPLTRALPIDIDYTHLIAKATIHLYATDPRLYDFTTQSQVVGLPSGTGGLTWPIVWPVSWGTAGAGGTTTCLNSGTFETRPLLTITGPIDNVTVQNNTTGLSFTWLGTLGSTDTLVIDMLHKVVQVNGSGNARGLVTPTSNWWTLIPGNNAVQFSANTVKVGSQLTVAFASAWV